MTRSCKHTINWFGSRNLLWLSFVFIFSFSCSVPRLWAAESNKDLLFGVEPEHNIFDQMKRYRVLADYLSSQLGVEVRLTIMSRYGEVVNRFKSLHLDGAFLSSFTATVAMKELYLTPIASLANADNSTISRGYIFTRKDNLVEVEGLRGKKAVFVDPATIEGYVFARAYFRQRGIEDLGSYFGQLDFSGSHASAIYAVLDGRADIGSAKDTVFNQLVSKEPSIGSELQVIAESPPVPEVTLCVKSDLDPQLMEKLRTSVLTMDQNRDGHRVLRQLEAKRFTPSSPQDFSVVFKILEDAGLSLSGSAAAE